MLFMSTTHKRRRAAICILENVLRNGGITSCEVVDFHIFRLAITASIAKVVEIVADPMKIGASCMCLQVR